MDILQGLILGIVQGLTEFLPVSSSAHLVFVPAILNVQSSLAYDTLLHVGSLAAVIGFFWKDIIKILKSFVSSLGDMTKRRFKEGLKEDQFKKLAWLIIIGMIPSGIAGIFLKDFFEGFYSNVVATGFFLIITGFLLWGSERVSKRITERKSVKEMTFKNSLVIGLAQAFAIFPGISRSGATISAALFLGVDRELAARYSFLLSIIAILGAALIQVKDITSLADENIGALIAGFLGALVAGYMAIKLILILIKERGLVIFAYYCWIVGILAIILSLFVF